jgi:uncharacterized UPF0146 family protein
MDEIKNQFSSGEIKTISLGISFMIEDVNEELEIYENANMTEAAQTSREVLSSLYEVLNKVRNLNL